VILTIFLLSFLVNRKTCGSGLFFSFGGGIGTGFSIRDDILDSFIGIFSSSLP